MEYRTLGRTGLKVSVMGIGAGGPSRLGQRGNVKTEAESVDIVLQGFDAGINFIDTAEGYGTEEIVGKAVAQRKRESIIISTKKSSGEGKFSPEQVVSSLDDSLRKLQTDYIDVYHVHGLRANKYDYCVNEIIPILRTAQQQGKIRHIGVTESWNSDLNHEMLKLAVQDDIWDVFMVGFNFLNQTARDSILLPSIEKNIGILIMFAVRRALSKPDYFREIIQRLITEGQIDPKQIDTENPLASILESGVVESLPDLAYRFCRDEAGTHVILSGTSNPVHMRANLDSLNRPILPSETISQLKTIFPNVTSVSGE
jgi:L-galactose dehydrogenase